MKKVDFTRYDSIAIWSTPKSTDNLDSNREKLFKESYKEKYFEESWMNDINLDRVIVGQNPGKEGNKIDDNSLLAFHWNKNSNDYRLAAALYGTSFWGAFMTDLNSEFNSHSDQVDADVSDVEDLLDKMDKLKINKDAKILSIGGKSFHAFKKYNKEKYGIIMHNDNYDPIEVEGHKVIYIPHYSGSNNGSGANDWNTENVHRTIKKYN
ncbi:hypothetical protein MOO46_05980 [Apilactobacillus apisilvae]|uniref:Uracil-DNA glycosylase-like domain-containing protein n=1 Tax=Apilactobacillus apisilvae TaxID=2923364 RepID=A0ABY4PHB7_9LACO|nr:hypothetical protein [Apilactobacillus apisilvae]UQS84792.1 hypothetical protein MOO46_05980 [Apilactobacillus apisilvae]